MSKKDDVDKTLAQKRQAVANKQAENSNIDAQISQLQTAKKKVNDITGDCSDARADVLGYDVNSDWSGTFRNKYNGRFSDAKTDYQTYMTNLDNVYDQIADKITSLKNKKNDNLGFIGDCEDVINNCLDWLDKFFHG